MIAHVGPTLEPKLLLFGTDKIFLRPEGLKVIDDAYEKRVIANNIH